LFDHYQDEKILSLLNFLLIREDFALPLIFDRMSMKTIAALLSLLFTVVASNAAPPSMISFTNNAVAAGNNTYVNIALNKFDTSLGTLTDVIVTVNFTALGGDFTVSTPGDSFTPADVESAAGRVNIRQATTNSLGFTQLGITSFGVATTPGLTYTVPAPSGSQLFAITSTNVFVGNSENIASGFWGAYQSAGGVGSVVFQVRNNPDITVSGGVFNLNALAFTADANMTVTYNYTPTAPIPEPGTWAVGALLLGGAAYSVWRRRQSAAVEPVAAA